ncbi:MAG: fibrobacter succinogenes major paralogous domain-containing protein, partial [Dysgonamonadaceae bacterium]|nr:fibrobacter succinogenes major paralogous domain-containing protein [Dysgonamonadaceae bacterium]
TQAVTVVAIPATPGTISFSSTEICAGATFTATVADVEHAASYEWTLPDGLSFVGASNGATITIRGNTVKTYAANSISVKAKNSFCSSGLSYNTQAVTVVAIPATPGTMTLSATTICGVGTTFTATVPNVAGVSYVWSLPAGLSGSSTSNSITIRGDVAKTYSAGSITVHAMISSCAGATSVSAQTVTVAAIPVITGDITFSTTALCKTNQNFTATIPAVTGATSYEWTVPTGLTIQGDATGNSITIRGTAVGTYSAGSISVRALTPSCSSAPKASTQDVTVESLLGPSNLSISITLNSTSVTLTATPETGCTINWYATQNAASPIPGGSQTNSVTVTTTTATSYWMQSYNTTTGCTNTYRAEVKLNVVPQIVSDCDLLQSYNSMGNYGKYSFINDDEYERNGIILSANVKIENSLKKSFASSSNSLVDFRNRNTDAETDTYGSSFTWCMVATHPDKLCPAPWRVPTRADFAQYALNSLDIIEIGVDGWVRGDYWTSESYNTNLAYGAYISPNDGFRPEFTNSRNNNIGHLLRCVRDK